jgi:hypothetical protein
MACIAPPKNSLEHRRASEEGKHESPRRISQHDAPNRVMTARTPPSRRSNSGPRLSPGDIYRTGGRAKNVFAHVGDASKEGNDTRGCRHLRNRPKAGKTFVCNAAHFPLYPPEWGIHPSCSHRHRRSNPHCSRSVVDLPRPARTRAHLLPIAPSLLPPPVRSRARCNAAVNS